MADNLNFSEKLNRHSYFGVSEPAWHGKGVTLDNPLNAEEAIIQSGSDFTVVKTPLITTLVGASINLKDKFATVRSDTKQVLGVVGNSYKVFQNSQVFSFFDQIIDRDEAIYHTGGVIGNGEKTWLLAKLPEYIKVGIDDVVENYVLLYNSHDGSSGIVAAFTNVRVVCQNTLNMALKGLKSQTSVNIRHTSNAEEQLREAHKILKLQSQVQEELASIFNAMTKRRMTEKEFKAYVETLFVKRMNDDKQMEEFSTRAENQMDEILEYAEIGYGQNTETCKGTLFGAYNAVTGWLDHAKEFKKDKLKSNWFGGSAIIRQSAFSSAMDILN